MNITQVMNILKTKGVCDLGINYNSVDENTSLDILNCISNSNDRFFLTINSKGNYVLMKKVNSDISTFFYPLNEPGRPMGIRRLDYIKSDKDAYEVALSTNWFKKILVNAFGNKANLYYNVFLNLLRYGCSLGEYINNSVIPSLGISYAEAIDCLILCYNALIARSKKTNVKDEKLYWGGSFVIGYNIIKNRVNLVFNKSIYAYDYEEYIINEEKKKNDNELKKVKAKECYLNTVSLNTLLSGINNNSSYGSSVSVDGTNINLQVSDFRESNRCDLLLNYLKTDNYIIINGYDIRFSNAIDSAKELTTQDFKWLFGGSKNDTSTLIHFITEGGNTPKFVTKLKSGRVKINKENMYDVLSACQDISLYKSCSIAIKEKDGYFSFMIENS